MKTVHLHGALAEFGGPFVFDVRDPAEAVRALAIQVPGFRAAVEAGSWQVIRGPLGTGTALSEEDLLVSMEDGEDLHLIPAVEGEGNGVGQVIVGIALIAVAWWNPMSWGAAATMALGGAGAGMAVGGIVQMATKLPSSDYGSREQADQRPSFLFDGPTNTSTQGLPVPVIYGRVKVGSVVISAGITSEEV